MAASDLEQDPDVQSVDVRFFFPRDTDREAFLDRISKALQESPEMAELTAAYEIKADTKPLA